MYILVLCVQEPLFRAGHFYEQDTLCIIVLMELPPSHTHTHTNSLCFSLTHCHPSPPLSPSHTHSVTHMHTCTHKLSLFLTHTLPSPPYPLSLSETHTHTHTLRHTHAHTNFLCFSLTHCHHLPTPPPPPPPSLKHTQNKLMALKETVDTGAQLDKDQQEAVTRLDEVTIQLELVRDLQKQFATAIVDVSVLLKVYWTKLLSIVVNMLRDY